ncbi:minor capsid protein [Acinetobacter gerneri]|uniref:minor capsid protein n=1 Tax=Acinetobacter gerneri TaxID=202952 RepID=UPI0028AA14E4|nr:minor capsid protein [Acinetobacter gerneri]
MNTSAQKALLDALTSHQAYLYRVSTQSVNEITKQFNSISKVKLAQLSELLDELTDSELKALKSFNFASNNKASKRIEEIKTLLSDWFDSVDVDLADTFNKSALGLAVYEATFTAKLMGEVATAVAGSDILKSAKKMPFSGGQLLDYLFVDIANTLRKKVENVIRDGISRGLTNQQIVQKIQGKKSLEYQDGILKSSRESIEKQVRTARSLISNTAYLETYKLLGFDFVRVLATLDGRTCKTCANLDGNVYSINDPAKPNFPIHPNNRTTYVGVGKDGDLPGKRPFVMDERKVKDIPVDERKGLIGQLDANTSFKDFVDQASTTFQLEWLGPSKYKLYKEGGYTLDKFVDPLGREYTLKELKTLDEKTFKELGL